MLVYITFLLTRYRCHCLSSALELHCNCSAKNVMNRILCLTKQTLAAHDYGQVTLPFLETHSFGNHRIPFHFNTEVGITLKSKICRTSHEDK